MFLLIDEKFKQAVIWIINVKKFALSLNVDSIILLYVLLSTTAIELLLSDIYRLRKADLILRFLVKSNLCNVIPNFYVFVLAIQSFS